MNLPPKRTGRTEQAIMQMPASQPAVVDIAGLKIAIYESEEMSGKSGYATRLWDCSVGLAQWMTQALVQECQKSWMTQLLGQEAQKSRMRQRLVQEPQKIRTSVCVI